MIRQKLDTSRNFFFIYYTWKNKKSYKNNKFKISASICNEKFELPDGYSVSGFQDYSYYIFKKHETIADNDPIKIYVNKIETGLYPKLKQGISNF